MSAAAIDAALATAIEALYAPEGVRQESDVRQDRERVEPDTVAYQLEVYEQQENPQRGSGEGHRRYVIQARIKRLVKTQPEERTWRLGGLDTGLAAMLARSFYLGLDLSPENPLIIDTPDPAVAEDPIVTGHVYSFAVTAIVEQAI